MSDLIYRQEIINVLDRVIEYGAVSGFSEEHPITAEAMKRFVEKLPSAEPDPEWRKKHYEMAYNHNQGYVDACKYYENLPERKKGKWIVTSEFSDCYYAKCNQCNVTQIFYYGKPLTNYCPNCGANMSEDEQND